MKIPHCKHCLESFDADTDVLYILLWVWVDTPSSPLITRTTHKHVTLEKYVSRASKRRSKLEQESKPEEPSFWLQRIVVGYTTALYSRSCHVIAFFVQLLLQCISSQNYSSTECLYLNDLFAWISSSILLLVLQFPGNKEWVDMCVSLHVDMHMTCMASSDSFDQLSLTYLKELLSLLVVWFVMLMMIAWLYCFLWRNRTRANNFGRNQFKVRASPSKFVARLSMTGHVNHHPISSKPM